MKQFSKYIIISIIIHCLLLWAGYQYYPQLLKDSQFSNTKKMKVVHRNNKPKPPPPKIKEDPEKGQIVELPKPLEEKRPKDTKYLAEHDQVVEEQNG